MNTLKNNLFALLVLIVAFTGCKKDSETVTNELTNSGIELINGYLAFKDSATFIEHLNWIRQNETNPEIIDQFNKKLGFESFSEVYDKGMRMTDPAEFEEYRKKNPDCFKKIMLEDNSVFWEMPMTSILSYLAEKHGVYQIDGTIIKNTEDIDFITGDPDKLSILFETTSALMDKKIVKNYKESNSSSRGHYSYRTAYFKWSDRRIVARLYATSSTYPTSHHYESRTTSQQRHWSGVWVKAKIDEVGQISQVGTYFMNTNNGTVGPFYISKPSVFAIPGDETRITMLSCSNPVINYLSSCLIDHIGKRDTSYAIVVDNELFSY